MHIAIEGLDGVGKTSTAKRLAEKLGFNFVEKPVHYLIDKEGMENYLCTTQFINDHKDSNITSVFYGLGNIYTADMAKTNNIVTDRHLASNYYWNCGEENKKLFDFIVKNCGKPDYTFVLYAPSAVRKARIEARNPEDPDLKDKVCSEEQYEKIREFMKRYDMPGEFIDNSNMSMEETVDYLLTVLEQKGICFLTKDF